MTTVRRCGGFGPIAWLIAIPAALAMVILALVVVLSLLKSSEVYRLAVARAQADPALQEVLGTPIREGVLVSGQVNIADTSGTADLSVPLSGPRGKGTLHVVATRSAGRWTLNVLHFETPQKQLDLLDKGEPSGTSTNLSPATGGTP